MSNDRDSPAHKDGKAEHWVDTEPVDKALADHVEARLDYSGAVVGTSTEEARLVRKLDWRIMPCLWSMYFLCVNMGLYVFRSAR